MVQVNLDYDLDEVSTEFEPLPSGQYLAKLQNPDDVRLTESSTGKAMIVVSWTVQEGEWEGRKVFDNVVLSVPWKVKQYCQAANIESGSELDTEDFVNTEALIQVTQEEYNQQIRNKVKNVQPAS